MLPTAPTRHNAARQFVPGGNASTVIPVQRKVMRGVLVLVLTTAAYAAADDDPPITISSESTEQPGHRDNEAPPLLRFDPTVRVAIERLDHQTTTVAAGPIAVHVTGEWRPFDPALVGEQISPMWRAGGGASLDLGFARLDARYGYEHVENELGAGLAKTMGLALTTTFRVFGKDAFVTLTLDRREWRDHLAPPGEFDATTVMLWFGLRW